MGSHGLLNPSALPIRKSWTFNRQVDQNTFPNIVCNLLSWLDYLAELTKHDVRPLRKVAFD